MIDSLPRSSTNQEYETSREPYELIIDKTLRSRAKRIQDETREQLTRCLERVEHVTIIICFKIKEFSFVINLFVFDNRL